MMVAGIALTGCAVAMLAQDDDRDDVAAALAAVFLFLAAACFLST